MNESVLATSSPAGSPVSAAFFLDGSRFAVDLVRAWRTAGYRVEAIVMPPRRHLRSHLRRLAAASAGAPVRIVARPVDWEALAAWIKPLAPTVLVSFGFLSLVPPEFLALFPNGGVNFHPALLPYYRGPQPMLCMIADGTWQTRGGMTLHVMSDRYDRGDIIASVAFQASDWRSPAHVRAACARAISDMAVTIIPLFCAGRIKAKAQPSGDFRWAQHAPGPLTVKPFWTVAHLATAAVMTRRRPGLLVEANGRLLKLGRLLERLGPPTGVAPTVRPFSVELDCRDGRVTIARASRAGDAMDWLRRRFHRQKVEIEPRSIDFETLNLETGAEPRQVRTR